MTDDKALTVLAWVLAIGIVTLAVAAVWFVIAEATPQALATAGAGMVATAVGGTVLMAAIRSGERS